jgi:hypothetical protein
MRFFYLKSFIGLYTVMSFCDKCGKTQKPSDPCSVFFGFPRKANSCREIGFLLKVNILKCLIVFEKILEWALCLNAQASC